MDYRAGITRSSTGAGSAARRTTDFSSSSKPAIRGLPNWKRASSWNRAVELTLPSFTKRPDHAPRIFPHLHVDHHCDHRGVWFPRAEEHWLADRGFPRHGAPDEGPRAGAAGVFRGWPWLASAGRGHGSDRLRHAEAEQ